MAGRAHVLTKAGHYYGAVQMPLKELQPLLGPPSPLRWHMAFPYGRLCSCADMALRSLRLSFVMGWCRCLSKNSRRSLPPSPMGPYGRPPVRSI